MFIDIHVHTRLRPCPPRPDGSNYATPQELVAMYDALGVQAGVILPGTSPEWAHGIQSNEELLDICAAYPGRFIPFCNVDPRQDTNSPDARLDRLLKWYKDRGYKGVGEVTANLPFSDPLVQNLFTHVEAAGLPLIFHIAHQIGGVYGLYDEPGLPQLEACLQRFARLNFLGHSTAFWAEITTLRQPEDRQLYPAYPIEQEGAVVRLMRRHPNLLGDLSAGSGYNALARDRAYAVKFINEFQDRLFFGTDICAPGQVVRQGQLLTELRDTGKISAAVFEKIARGNAIKLLSLQ